jgi:hypothetical protein
VNRGEDQRKADRKKRKDEIQEGGKSIIAEVEANAIKPD